MRRSSKAPFWFLLAAPLASHAAEPPTLPGRADLNPDNDHVVAPPDPVHDCEAALKAARVEFAPAALPRKTTRGGYSCGAEQTVRYKRGPGQIRYGTQPILTCGMALALARFEELAQEEAQRHFGARVARLELGGTYSCREMSRFRMVSEHSYANAIDLYAFVLDDGRRVSVLQHFGRLDREPSSPRARFLRKVARRAYDEGLFSVVLTPFFDGLHANHFHLDLARYRVDGTR